jgi:AcrR family transcriptional regulator
VVDSPPPPATSALKRRSARAERRRERILDAAAQIFGLHGFAKATVEEIAGNAGVSKGLVYAYFDSKDQLFDAVLARTLEEWTQVTWEQIQRQATGAVSALEVMQRASLDYARRNRFLSWMLQQDSPTLWVTHKKVIDQAIQNWHRRLVGLLHQGVESGELRRDLDIERTVAVIQVFHLGFIEQLFAPGWGDVADDSMIEAGVRLISHGIANAGPSGEGEQT